MCSVTKLCLTLCDPVDCSPPGSSVRGILQARRRELGCRALHQGIFPTQGSNWSLLHWQGGSLPLSHVRSPLIYWLLPFRSTQQRAKDPPLQNARDCGGTGGGSFFLCCLVSQRVGHDLALLHHLFLSPLKCAAVHGVAKSRTWLSDWTELNWRYESKLNVHQQMNRWRCGTVSINNGILFSHRKNEIMLFAANGWTYSLS